MSLPDEMLEKCVMLDKITVSDGYGGITEIYKDGAEFNANVNLVSSTEAIIAAVQGVKNLYKVITKKNITLKYHDVFKRIEDGKVFRITSDGKDDKTPDSAELDMRSTSAEEYKPENRGG